MIFPLIRRIMHNYSNDLRYVQMGTYRFNPSVLRYFSTRLKEPEKHSQTQEERQEKANKRRAYAIGGCTLFMWTSMHGILLYKRRREFRSLNERTPAIPWNQFVEEYLGIGKVKTIIYQPLFETGNVYLHSPTNTQLGHTLTDFLTTAPDKYLRPPDVRFIFDGSKEDVKQALIIAQKVIADEGIQVKEIEFELDEFPNSKEMLVIVGATLATLVTLTLA